MAGLLVRRLGLGVTQRRQTGFRLTKFTFGPEEHFITAAVTLSNPDQSFVGRRSYPPRINFAAEKSMRELLLLTRQWTVGELLWGILGEMMVPALPVRRTAFCR